jgi:hypothetical protein
VSKGSVEKEEEQMLFATEEGNILFHGHVFYRQSDDMIDFVPWQRGEHKVRVGKSIEIGFTSSHHQRKRACHIWGCVPRIRWQKQKLDVPAFFPGSLILLDEARKEGDLVRLEGFQEWNTYFDPATAWVCIGDAVWSLVPFSSMRCMLT